MKKEENIIKKEENIIKKLLIFILVFGIVALAAAISIDTNSSSGYGGYKIVTQDDEKMLVEKSNGEKILTRPTKTYHCKFIGYRTYLESHHGRMPRYRYEVYGLCGMDTMRVRPTDPLFHNYLKQLNIGDSILVTIQHYPYHEVVVEYIFKQ